MESSQPYVHFVPNICIMKYVKLFKTAERKCVYHEKYERTMKAVIYGHNQVDGKNEKCSMIILS